MNFPKYIRRVVATEPETDLRITGATPRQKTRWVEAAKASSHRKFVTWAMDALDAEAARIEALPDDFGPKP